MGTRIRAAVPVFRVANVAKSMAWYRDVLGFRGDSVGPPDDPSFAIVRRDDVELMLQKRQPGMESRAAAAEGNTAAWDAYLRIDDARAWREAVSVHAPNAGPIQDRIYGCREFVVTDPDGHTIVLGQCG